MQIQSVEKVEGWEKVMEEGGFCGNATRGEFNDRRDEGAASGWVPS